jgi:hypothetical protein
MYCLNIKNAGGCSSGLLKEGCAVVQYIINVRKVAALVNKRKIVQLYIISVRKTALI